MPKRTLFEPGMKFGRLTVIENLPVKNGHSMVRCVCGCPQGNEVIVSASNLNSGNTRSCGCLFKETCSDVHSKHRMRDTRLYNIWYHMKQRCENPKNTAYKDYGGRGITVAEEWRKDFLVYYNFAITHGYDDSKQQDRIDNNKLYRGYSPENVRWVDGKQNCRNRRTNHFITIGTETRTIAEWAEISGISQKTIQNRIQLGWPESRLLLPKKERRAVLAGS